MLFKINTADSRPFSLWEGGVWVQEYWQTGLHLLPVNLTGNIAYIHQVGGAVGICDKATSIDFHYCATCNTASIWSNPVYICVCVCVCVCVCGVCVCVCLVCVCACVHVCVCVCVTVCVCVHGCVCTSVVGTYVQVGTVFVSQPLPYLCH